MAISSDGAPPAASGEHPHAADAVPERAQVADDGLTAAEVSERIARGEVNRADERNSRTIGEIVRANVFTRFNALLGAIGRKVSCGIYHHRPRACRTVQPGDGDCLRARREQGLT